MRKKNNYSKTIAKNKSAHRSYTLRRAPTPRSQKTRDERDPLGVIQVPADAPWGAQTARALENFRISGETADPALLRAYLRIKLAAARANLACRVLEPREASLIEQAITRLLDPKILDNRDDTERKAYFPVDIFQAGAGTSQNMNLNETVAQLANRLAGRRPGIWTPVHPNDHVNASQSTNDTYPTAMRLALLEVSKSLVASFRALEVSLRRHATEWSRIPKSARTHLQDAVPIRLGAEWGAYARTVGRIAGWIEDAREELRELGIGGSAAGTGINVPRAFPARIVADLSKLTQERLRLSPDLYESMQSMAPFAQYSSQLRIAALELTRICNDLRLLSSGPTTGFGELILPAVQPGSSIMPGKVNPSILEMTHQVAFAVLGHDQTVAFATQAGQLELNVMMPVISASLLKASRILANAVTTLRESCIEGIRPDQQRLLRYFESTPQIATALSPRLGYARTAELVKEAVSRGKSVVELVREKGLLEPEELDRLLEQAL